MVDRQPVSSDRVVLLSPCGGEKRKRKMGLFLLCQYINGMSVLCSFSIFLQQKVKKKPKHISIINFLHSYNFLGTKLENFNLCSESYISILQLATYIKFKLMHSNLKAYHQTMQYHNIWHNNKDYTKYSIQESNNRSVQQISVEGIKCARLYSRH